MLVNPDHIVTIEPYKPNKNSPDRVRMRLAHRPARIFVRGKVEDIASLVTDTQGHPPI